MQCPERGAHTAIWLLILDGQFERARPLVEKLSSQANSSVSVPSNNSKCAPQIPHILLAQYVYPLIPYSLYVKFLAVRGWLELLSGKDSQSALDHFERAVALDKNVDGFLGKAQFHKIRSATHGQSSK